MDFDLTDEQQLIQRTAREFTDNEIIAQSRENARNHHFDLDLVKKVAAQGYLGAIVPQEYGGAGLDYFSYGLVVEEIGRGDSAMRTVISVQTSLVCSAILKFGTEEQKHKYLPKLCSGEWLGCFGLTEPDTGSDAANQKTRAHKTDSGWVINGAKMWISMGNYAKVAMIFAQTDPALGHKGIACFLVDTDQPGYTAQTIEHKMGLHASDTASISLEDVEVADEDMLGEVGDGFKVAMSLARLRALLASPRVAWASARAVSRSRSVRQGARAVRQTDRLLPARAGDDRRHGAEDRRLADARLARGMAQGPGPAEHDGDLDRQAARNRGVARVREPRDPGPRRRGLCRRPPGRALLPRCPRDDAVRGNQPDPEADHRARHDRNQRARSRLRSVRG